MYNHTLNPILFALNSMRCHAAAVIMRFLRIRYLQTLSSQPIEQRMRGNVYWAFALFRAYTQTARNKIAYENNIGESYYLRCCSGCEVAI